MDSFLSSFCFALLRRIFLHFFVDSIFLYFEARRSFVIDFITTLQSQLSYASYTPSSSCVSATKLVLGIRSQIIELKLSFWFWVLSCKHFFSKLSSLSSAKVRFNFITISNGKPGPGLYPLVPLTLSWWNLHQLSFPSGQWG